MVRELLEDPSWTALHVEGKMMPADLGTKALAADRFGFLVDRMRVVRRRQSTTRTAEPVQARRLITLLCIALLVEQVEAAEIEDRGIPDYLFFGICLVAVIAIWESVKSAVAWLVQCCGSTGWSRRAEERTRSVAEAPDLGSSDSLGDSSLEPSGLRPRPTRRSTTTRMPDSPRWSQLVVRSGHLWRRTLFHEVASVTSGRSTRVAESLFGIILRLG